MERRTLVKAAAASVALGAAAVLAGCEKKESPVSTEPGAPMLNLGKTQQWKMVTAWPKNFPGLGTGANYLAQLIESMTGGRIKVKVYGAGELVPAFEVFDAVAKGTAELGHGAAYYWKGKTEAAQFFTTVPFGLNAQEMSGWIHYGGGQQLWDELYAPFGLKPFGAGNTGVQMGGWFNKEIKSIADLKGLKMRMPGLGAEVLERLGATPVNLPGGEIFQSLQSGAIDATEWVGPYNDLAFGFYKVAKYYYWPGWHEPGSVMEGLVNKKVFEALSPDLQAIITAAMRTAYEDMLAEFTARNSSALKTLVGEHKVQLKRFPDEVLKQLGQVSKEVVEGLAAKDPAAKKIYESFEAFRKSALSWTQIGEEGYSLARALTFG
ncbi:MAG: ABC transporter substrate-binding protein [Candidatus Lambdaproteobacteria bacterium RIFOXYD1_FULL_56_27]|uniref:ABC transporter substrate-binding protein n=1 Tax=Candidatus Lambdaproteobacteria bacterium RIFOXYD2_FULL_56_26 TaxID=1817773 RepID=A0A1F6GL71_9PROT|nr:MAG: ABC transporter substrate-binding protein [Candidatus Lambdaproteobacteria bacterium RIFOXYD2_FULL_56_26]OGH03580.1 MAG: ABC transporter substrate-binding protein [Candidatus Lambdaproteobacteria bacterium RIFOXYC1_FULL_56_13]OGH08717.1 MAG: ABC transporter substrate-binding protein [Candidatus Lambdaproteobacteria bacterium RIFOXYD1_FULL_56_27]